MSEHFVIIQTRKAIKTVINPKGMSVHDGKVIIPASHANWLLKRIEQLETSLEIVSNQLDEELLRR